MANRKSGGRPRSRKRRPAARAAPAHPAPPKPVSRREVAGREPPAPGERPQAPWHPLPLSELLILVGAIGVIVGLLRGGTGGAAPLFAGIGAVAIGTIEVTLREHRSGFRSHTILLAALPAIALHTAVVLTVAAFTRVPHVLNAGLLVLDAAVFLVLFRLLRARFQDASRERRFASGR